MNANVIPILIMFLSYATIIMVIAYLSTHFTKNLSDYVLAGRKLSGPITAFGAGASDMSSWLLMALPGAVYADGLNVVWMAIALSLGAYYSVLLPSDYAFIQKYLMIH